MDIEKITNEIIRGRRLKRKDDLSFLKNEDLKSLGAAANRIRKTFIGDYARTCSVLGAKNGRCPENCRYCAQSIYNNTGCEVYGFKSSDEILNEARKSSLSGIDRFAMVTSGRKLDGEEFTLALKTAEKIKKETDIYLCASFGLMTEEEYSMMKDAGISCIHNNLETSSENFKNVCTSHSFSDKITALRAAKKAGLSICSGGIIGLGEGIDDRISLALSLSELGVQNIPINVLIPIKGTGTENLKPLKEDEILRSIAIFRFINPKAAIIFAGGRRLLSDNGEKALNYGLSSIITGDMLTTSGSTIRMDRDMLVRNNRTIREEV